MLKSMSCGLLVDRDVKTSNIMVCFSNKKCASQIRSFFIYKIYNFFLKKSLVFGLFLSFFAATFGSVCHATRSEQCLPASGALPAEAKPVPLNFPEWASQFERLNKIVSESQSAKRQLLFIGDSLTYGWHSDETLFYQSFKEFRPLNLGIFGDRTEGVIYRLRTGWGALNPKLAVLLIGTNNIATGSNPTDVAIAISEIVSTIKSRSAETRILIVSILPRGDKSSPLQNISRKVNEIISSCVDGKSTFFIDIAPSFLDSTGRFSPDLTTDKVHLTRAGYEKFASLILPKIRTLMAD